MATALMMVALGSAVTGTAQAATSTFIGYGGGNAGPVHIYGVSMLCEGPYPGASGYTGSITLHGQSSAAANISYNFEWEVDMAYGGAWHTVAWGQAQRRSGSQYYLDDQMTIGNMDPNNRHLWRAFLWIQNPLTGYWYYASALSNGGTTCTL